MRETDLQPGIPVEEARELMYKARHDRAQMARRLNAEIARRHDVEYELGKERERKSLGYSVVDVFSGYFRRMPFLKKFAKSVILGLLQTWRKVQGKGPLVLDEEAAPVGPVEDLGFGVNMAGHLNSEKGVGEGGRATLRSLRAAQVPCHLVNTPDLGSSNIEQVDSESSEKNPYDFNLVHINADGVPAFAMHIRSPFRERYNIGYWAWELPSLPPVWCESFKYFDEVWVPSTFCLDAVSRASPIPVVRIPHSINEDIAFDPTCTRSQFGIGPDTFVFLFFFDFHSFTERKNPEGLIEAFRRAFSPEDDAMLFIKCARSEWAPEALKRLQEASAGSNVKLYDAVISRPTLNSLMSMCDSYVSLHRSEGFGLTLSEAMYMSKPVIATGYSGNMDFMNLSNSFPVKYRIVEIDKDYGPYMKGSEWADPDLDHAAEMMRYIYTHRDKAAEVGKRARLDVSTQLHPRTVGRLIRERLVKSGREARIRRMPANDAASAADAGKAPVENSAHENDQVVSVRTSIAD